PARLRALAGRAAIRLHAPAAHGRAVLREPAVGHDRRPVLCLSGGRAERAFRRVITTCCRKLFSMWLIRWRVSRRTLRAERSRYYWHSIARWCAPGGDRS